MFVCAVDPSYLTTRVINENDVLYEQDLRRKEQHHIKSMVQYSL